MKPAFLLMIAASLAVASPAFAQSDCYKGECGSLDTRATGSNYGPLDDSFPARASGTSGGGVDTSYLGMTESGPCQGFATVLPDHTFHLHSGAVLRFQVEAFRDTTLLVHGPDGWRCNDSPDDVNPGLTDYFEPGDYRVWVGSDHEDHHDYRLSVDERRNEPARTHQPHDRHPSLDATSTTVEHESLIIDAGDGISRLQGRAGGAADARELDEPSCVGFTQSDPDHIITLTDRLELEISVQSRVDTTLVVHGPHGWMCNDDAYDIYPALDGSFPPGTYRVWVGTYERLDSDDYLLTISPTRAEDLIEEPLVPMIARYTFRGRFESLDVTFAAHSVDELYAQCLAFLATSESVGWVDDIVVNGRAWRNGPSYWSEENLCSIVALNAVPDRPHESVVVGSIDETVPFDVRCGDVEQVISRYIPSATADLWIDDIEVNGQSMHHGPGYWTGSQAADIVLANISDPAARYSATGTIEDTAFSFSGETPTEIQSSCAVFIDSAMAGEWIDDVVVGGQARHNNSGWWSPADVCMIIGSLAQER
jgi:hypothetical protein